MSDSEFGGTTHGSRGARRVNVHVMAIDRTGDEKGGRLMRCLMSIDPSGCVLSVTEPVNRQRAAQCRRQGQWAGRGGQGGRVVYRREDGNPVLLEVVTDHEMTLDGPRAVGLVLRIRPDGTIQRIMEGRSGPLLEPPATFDGADGSREG